MTGDVGLERRVVLTQGLRKHTQICTLIHLDTGELEELHEELSHPVAVISDGLSLEQAQAAKERVEKHDGTATIRQFGQLHYVEAYLRSSLIKIVFQRISS